MKLLNIRNIRKIKSEKIISDLITKNNELRNDLANSEITIETKVKKLDHLISEVEAAKQLFEESISELKQAQQDYKQSEREFQLLKIKYEKDIQQVLKGV